MAKLKENSISALRTQGIDLSSRWESILEKLSESHNFDPNLTSLRKSQWWKTEKIGAVSISGIFKDHGNEKDAVLKIQGSNPYTSEVDMIRAFELQNQSSIVRTPHIYSHIPWNETEQYEAIVFEDVKGNVILSSYPPTKLHMDEFFTVYEEYRSHCRNKPWIERPANFDYHSKVAIWKSAVAHQEKSDKYKKSEDIKFVERAIRILEKEIQPKDLDFEHGHLAASDIKKVSDKEYVLFSNLFWGWRNPFYDAVFEYHWSMLGLQRIDGTLNSEIIDTQRKTWLDKIYSLNEIKGNSANQRFLELALLERAIPALIVDRYMIDLDNSNAGIIIESARKELKRLIKLFS